MAFGGFAGGLACTENGGDCVSKDVGEPCGDSGACVYPEVATCTDVASDCVGKGIGDPCGAGTCLDPRTFGCVAGDLIGALCTVDTDCCDDPENCPTGACANPTILSSDTNGDDPVNVGEYLACLGGPPLSPDCSSYDEDGDGDVDDDDANIGDNSYFTLTMFGRDNVLDGFTIRSANDERVDGLFRQEGDGGGLLISGSTTNRSQAEIRNCRIVTNRAREVGAGVTLTNADVTFTNCTVADNHDANAGGGVASVAADLFEPGNSNATFVGCQFVRNSARAEGGGALFNYYAAGGSATFINTLIADNSVWESSHSQGGGLKCVDEASCTLINTTVVGNTAANSTGEGGGLWLGSGQNHPASVTNSIIWGNTGAYGPQMALLHTPTTVSHSDLEGGIDAVFDNHQCSSQPCLDWSAGNLDGDLQDDYPDFVDADAANYRIRRGPCVDRADNNAIAGYATDLGGRIRIMDDPLTQATGSPGGRCAYADMGAYEFQVLNAPSPDPRGDNKSRFISFISNNPGLETAIQVELVDLPQFPAYNGRSWFVRSPSVYAEHTNPPMDDFLASTLWNSGRDYRDWSASALAAQFPDADTSVVHVYDCAIVPGSVYRIRESHPVCVQGGLPVVISEPLTVTTGKWGDVIAPFYPSAGQPAFTDINAQVMKYKRVPYSAGDPPTGGPPQVWAMLRGDVPPVQLKTDFQDIGYAVNGYKGIAFNFAGPTFCHE